MTIIELTKIAASLGIKLTTAEEGTEMFEAWADRVIAAKMDDEQFDMWAARDDWSRADSCAIELDAAIAEANRYAI
jgi:hypothetical protein